MLIVSLPAFVLLFSTTQSWCALGQIAETPDGVYEQEQFCQGGTPEVHWNAAPFANQTDKPTSIWRTDSKFAVYSNIWLHAHRYHAITDRSSAQLSNEWIEIGKNTVLVQFPVEQASHFYQNIEAHWLAGVTLVIDFPYPAYPNNVGYWAEVLIPIYCTLASSEWQAAVNHSPVKNIIFTNLQRSQVVDIDWLWKMWAVVLSPLKNLPSPIIIFWDDACSVARNHWLGIEHVLIPNNRFSFLNQPAGFWETHLGQDFRKAAYHLAGINLPPKLPQTITYLAAVGGEVVANQADLVDRLEDVANSLQLRVRPYTVTHEAPFASFLSAMSRTGVLVARHGPLLANAIFLPPGAVVIELLPYNWEYEGTSTLYRNLTSSVGDIHHFAWRAQQPWMAMYQSPADALYHQFLHEECKSMECLVAHAGAAMLADVDAIQELLYKVVQDVYRGRTVSELAHPWPSMSPVASVPWYLSKGPLFT